MIGPLSYIGGKRRVAKQLVALLPEHTTYVEPFAGGAQLFFHKPRSKVEVLNDIDEEIISFLRVCQRHPEELSRCLRWQPASRRVFERYEQQSIANLTDIERAARFFYLQKNTWSGKRIKRNFHFMVSKRSNYSPETLDQRFAAVASRLDGVLLEASPYQAVLRRYDRPTTFFYCDPPYVGIDAYEHNFTDDQFEELASSLSALKGRFLLSINDCEKARAWFAQWPCREISFAYTSTRKVRRFRELLFANYPLPITPTALTPLLQIEGRKEQELATPHTDVV